MQYRRVGSSGLKVSAVALGGWLTHGRTLTDSSTSDIVHKAFDLGINTFDTADVYNNREAEKALGKALKGLNRDHLVVATKCFWPMSDDPNDRGLGRKHVLQSLEGSLKHLQLEYVDVMQFHRFDVETPLEESIRAVDDLIRQGKALYWGVSEWQADQIADAVHIARAYGCHPPISDQPLYNMLHRRIEERVLPTCERHGLGAIVFSPMAQGILSGKYKPGEAAAAGSRGADSNSNRFMVDMLADETLTRVANLDAWVRDRNLGMAEFALAWCLRNPVVAAVIVGSTTPAQIEQNARAADIELSQEEWKQAEAILEVAEI